MLRLILLFLILMNINLSAKEWVQKHYIYSEHITTLQCVDSANCYAFAEDVMASTNRIYKSTDQGNTWEGIYAFYEDSLMSIGKCFVLDTSNIYLTYSGAFLVDKSTDGGKTFKRTNFEENGKSYNGWIFDFVMYNKNIGFIVSYNSIFYTTDGWKTYKSPNIEEYHTVGAPIFFIDSNNVAVSEIHARGDVFLKFNLDTEKWTPYNTTLQIPDEEYEETMHDVCFVNDSVGFACGGQKLNQGISSSDIIWKTSDTGKHWNIIHEEIIDKSSTTQKITFSDEKHGMAVGSWGKIMETTDGGETWFYHNDLPKDLTETILVRVALAGDNNIVSTLRGGIYRYEDDISVQESEFQDVIFDIKQTPEHITINISDDRHRKYSLQIADMSGKSMYEGSLLYSLENVVSLSGFASGVYIYRIMCGGALARSGKFVITK
ncbi:MAG: YCF48-related protein [Candidatus Kapabacteria bacterium]|jgi:photosystem II stability/assembly factor-like uncharacterized protein|nr:YCF48-related protein [Candidatus Kapabacteria bacterium]